MAYMGQVKIKKAKKTEPYQIATTSVVATRLSTAAERTPHRYRRSARAHASVRGRAVRIRTQERSSR